MAAVLPELAAGAAPIGEPLRQLIEAIWNHEPPRVALIRGRWRWRGTLEELGEVRNHLARGLGPGTVPLDLENSRIITLPPTEPSSRPCEVALYPTLLLPSDPAEGPRGTTPIYMCLFYSMQNGGREPSLADRERGYYRVVESLDRFHEALLRAHPGQSVQAIDLPMPGWMGAQLGRRFGNSCPLVSG